MSRAGAHEAVGPVEIPFARSGAFAAATSLAGRFVGPFRHMLLGIVFLLFSSVLSSTGCIWVAVGAGGGAVAGAAAADEDRDAGDVITDAALVTRVKAALVAAEEVSATRVKVYAHLGVITLKGYVRSEGEARRAMAAAKKVRGVKKVVAKMTIDSD